MQHLFWRLNFLLLSGATHSGQMYHEASALTSELDSSWSYRSRELMTLYSKAKTYEAGESVSFGGKEFAPLYTPKNDTLLNLFQITQDEQRQLRTIIGTDITQERDRKRHESRRRVAGAIDRATYESRSAARQQPWKALEMSRASWYRAGKPTEPDTKLQTKIVSLELETSASVLLMAKPPGLRSSGFSAVDRE